MSITAANATITFVVSTAFPTPFQIQGFAADDVYTSQDMKIAETLMGVDGKLSGGFTYVPVVQTYALQADSPTNAIFDAWYALQLQAKDVFQVQGITVLTGLDTSWIMSNGFLTSYHPIPDAKKLLQPRKYEITWESISPGPA